MKNRRRKRNSSLSGKQIIVSRKFADFGYIIKRKTVLVAERINLQKFINKVLKRTLFFLFGFSFDFFSQKTLTIAVQFGSVFVNAVVFNDKIFAKLVVKAD